MNKLDERFVSTSDIVEEVKDTIGNSTIVTQPDITGADTIHQMSSEVYTASGSLTAFKDNGATIDHYEWILPDDTTASGDIITITFTGNIGDEITIKARAVDTLNNYSRYTSFVVTIVDTIFPIIDNIAWDNDVHEEQQTYTMTITAHDPDGTVDDYDVTCNDPNVTIVQDTTNPNIFSVTYPDYPSDTQVTYTVSVTDNESNVTSETIVKTVHVRGKTLYKAIVLGFSSRQEAKSAIASGQFGNAFVVSNIYP
jgi:hypothetical protein